MEEVIRGYFDACNSGDADAVAKYFAPGAVHYFPPDMYEGPFRGGETIGAKWSWAVRTLGSHWTVDEIICDPDTDRAVIEWTHEKTKAGVVLRGDEWYHFDPDSGLITEIRAYYASPQAAGLDRLELAGYPYAERGYAASELACGGPPRDCSSTSAAWCTTPPCTWWDGWPRPARDTAGAGADRRAGQRPGRAVAADAAPPGDRTAVLGAASRGVRGRGGRDLGYPGHDAPAVRAARAGVAARRDGGPDDRGQGGRAAARRADQRPGRLPRPGLGRAAGTPEAVRRHRRRQPHRGDEARSAGVWAGRRGARPACGADRVPRRHAVERRGCPPGGMAAVRVPWDDPGRAIDTARTLLRLPPRQPRDDY